MIADDVELSFDHPVVLVVAFLIGVLACTRIARLVVDDDFPPIRWIRERYINHTSDDWGALVECPWCIAPYIVAVDMGWAWASGLAWHWWFGNVLAAASWLVGWLNMRDIPPESR